MTLRLFDAISRSVLGRLFGEKFAHSSFSRLCRESRPTVCSTLDDRAPHCTIITLSSFHHPDEVVAVFFAVMEAAVDDGCVMRANLCCEINAMWKKKKKDCRHSYEMFCDFRRRFKENKCKIMRWMIF